MVIRLYESDGESQAGYLQGYNGRALVDMGGYGTIVSFTKTITTAGTAERLIATATPCRKVWVMVATGQPKACVGGSTTLATAGSEAGIQLLPGNPAIPIDIDDLNKLYGDVLTNGGKICGVYLL